MGYQNDITVRKTVVYNAYCNNVINDINYFDYIKHCKDLIGAVIRNPNNVDVVSNCNRKLLDMKYDKIMKR